jgi:hypothetical protein
MKILGMVHIKGVNDKAYAEYVKSLANKPTRQQVMISVVKNRW